MKFTKILSILLAIITVISLAACGGNENPADGTTEGSTADGTTVGSTTVDVEGTTADTAEGTTADTAEGTTADTAEGTTADTAEGTTAGPAEGTTADSAEGTTAGPAEGTTADTEEDTDEDEFVEPDLGADAIAGGLISSDKANFVFYKDEFNTYKELTFISGWQDLSGNKDSTATTAAFCIKGGRLVLKEDSADWGGNWAIPFYAGHKYRIHYCAFGDMVFGANVGGSKEVTKYVGGSEASPVTSYVDITIPEGTGEWDTYLLAYRTAPAGAAAVEWYQIVDITTSGGGDDGSNGNEGTPALGADDIEGGLITNSNKANLTFDNELTSYKDLTNHSGWQDWTGDKASDATAAVFCIKNGKLILKEGSKDGGSNWAIPFYAGHTYRIHYCAFGEIAFGAKVGNRPEVTKYVGGSASAPVTDYVDITIPEGTNEWDTRLLVYRTSEIGAAAVEWYQIVDITE